MHNRKRVTQADPEKAERTAKKCAKLSALQSQVLLMRAQGNRDQTTFDLTTNLLSAMTDFSTAWNLRREILLDRLDLPQQPTPLSPLLDIRIPTEKSQKYLLPELEFTQECVKNNPKSYGVWHQRRWILNLLILAGKTNETDQNKGNENVDHVGNELALCAKFLALDARNFHCWRHRMWVTQQQHQQKISKINKNQQQQQQQQPQPQPTDENQQIQQGISQIQIEDLEQIQQQIRNEQILFTNAQLLQDPSNYSAWHYRSKSIGAAFFNQNENRTLLPPDALRKEFELVHQAVFTEPDDQSAWFYFRWLVENCDEKDVNVCNLLRDQISVCDELLSLDTNLKWPQLGVVFVFCALSKNNRNETQNQNENENSLVLSAGDKKRALNMISSLTKIDPMRTNYFASLQTNFE